MRYEFNDKLWEWQGQGSWFFISVPEQYYEEIKEISNEVASGFGSVKVEVTIGKTTWNTSIFPDSKSKTFLLPVKKEIRTKEHLDIGSECSVSLSLVQLSK